MMKKTSTVLSLVAATALTLSACSSSETPENTAQEASNETTTIVTSTSVWGDVASAVDPDADVTAIVSDSNTDPHSFEASAADIASAIEADVVVVGGGGYDSWLYEPVMEDKPDAKIIHALELTSHDHAHDHGDHEGHDHGDHEGHDHGEEADAHAGHNHGEEADAHAGHDHGEETDAHAGHDHGEEADAHADHVHTTTVDGNEHIWFDVDSVSLVAESLAEAIDGDATAVVDRMDDLRERLEALSEANVAQTETIGDYIIDDSSLVDVTPAGYRSAILGHSTPAAADLAAFLDAIEAGEVDILLFNPQTATDQTTRVHDAAEENDVTIIEIGEIPPEGTDFLDYFEQIVTEIENAVK